MAKGKSIIVSGNPKGVFEEGIITDTSKPGSIMEMVPAVALVGGRASWRLGTRAAGAKGPNWVLREDRLQGKTMSDAYVANTRCFLYMPASGEEVNVLFADIAGTACTEEVNIGDKLGVSGGKLAHDSSYTSTPFQAMESVLGFITTDFLLWCKYLGDNA